MLLDKLNKTKNQLTSYYQNIVSICFNNEEIFVVEIKKTIRELLIVNSKCYNISENVFNEINSDFNLKDKRITVNFYPPSGSFKILEIPKMPEAEIESWLNDNTNDFLPTGLTVIDLFLSFKIIKSNDTILLLLGIINKEEINSLIEKIKHTEGVLCNISPGFLNSIKVEKTGDNEKETKNYYIEHEDYHELIIYENESLIYYNQVPKAFQSTNRIDSINKLYSKDMQLLNIEIIDENLNTFDLETDIPVDFTFEKEFLPAYTSAVLELEKKDTFNLLPKENLLDSELITWKQIFLRFSLVAGISVFVIYLFAFILVFIMGQINAGLEEDRAALAPQLSQVNLLQTQKSNLENDLRAASQVKQYKSNSSILLDMFSFHIPKNCWMTEIIYNDESEKAFNIILKGMSKDEGKINNFLKNLESDNNLKSVKLDYINKLTRDEMYRDWKIRSSVYLEFQIALNY